MGKPTNLDVFEKWVTEMKVLHKGKRPRVYKDITSYSVGYFKKNLSTPVATFDHKYTAETFLEWLIAQYWTKPSDRIDPQWVTHDEAGNKPPLRRDTIYPYQYPFEMLEKAPQHESLGLVELSEPMCSDLPYDTRVLEGLSERLSEHVKPVQGSPDVN